MSAHGNHQTGGGRRRGRRARKVKRTPGSSPGLLHAPPGAGPTALRLIGFGGERYEEFVPTTVAEVAAHRGRWPMLWLDVTGLADVELLAKVGDSFGIHPLALEDVVHTDQRAKADRFGDSMFLVARTPMPAEDGGVATEQYAMFFGAGFVVTFQEFPGDCFDRVRERIRTGRPRVRSAGADYLVYALLDAIIDSYFPFVEAIGDRLELLEREAASEPGKDTASRIQQAKSELIALRRAIWPHREAVRTLMLEGEDLLTEETRLHLRDCEDHASKIIDLVEQYRELCSDLMSVYLSSVSNRMTEAMKVLTIIATIFIPLSFVASVYGMNFDTDRSPWNMPELRWAYGYPAVLLLMLAIGIGLLWYFKRKGWLG